MKRKIIEHCSWSRHPLRRLRVASEEVANCDNRHSDRCERIRRVLRTALRWALLWNKFGKCSSIRRLRSERAGVREGATGAGAARGGGSGDSAARRDGRRRRRDRTSRSRTCVAAGAMGTTPPPAASKQHKSRRKISLPWFRQSSVNAPHAALSRQHTIDTPSSFHARLLKVNRQRQVIHRVLAPNAGRGMHPPPTPSPPPSPKGNLRSPLLRLHSCTCTCYIKHIHQHATSNTLLHRLFGNHSDL